MEDLYLGNESDNEKYYDYIYDGLEEDIYGRTAEQAENEQNDSSLKTEGPQQVAVQHLNYKLSRIESLHTEDHISEESITEMKQENELLRRRLSELLKTARIEIERKNDRISELTKELDDLLLKRNRPFEQKGKYLNFDKRKRNTDSSLYYKKHQAEQRTTSFEKHSSIEHVMKENLEIINNFLDESEDYNFSKNVNSFSHSSNQLTRLQENEETAILQITQKPDTIETDESLVKHPNLFSARMHNKRRTNHERNSIKMVSNSGQSDIEIIQENRHPVLTNPKCIPEKINQDVVLNHKKDKNITIEPKQTKLEEKKLSRKASSVIKIADTNLEDPRLLKAGDVEQKAIDLRIKSTSVSRTDTKVENDPLDRKSTFIAKEKQKNEQSEPVTSKESRRSTCEREKNTDYLGIEPVTSNIRRKFTCDIEKSTDDIGTVSNFDEKKTDSQITENLDQRLTALYSKRIPKLSDCKDLDTRDILSDLHGDVQASLRDTMKIGMSKKCNNILKDWEAKPRNQSITNNKIRPNKVSSNSRDKSKTRLARGRSKDREKEDKEHKRNYSTSKHDSRDRSRERGRHRSRSTHYNSYREGRCRSRSGRSRDRRDKSSRRDKSWHRSRSRDQQRNRPREKISRGNDRKNENSLPVKDRSRSSSNESRENKTKKLVKISIDEYKNKVSNFKVKSEVCKLDSSTKSKNIDLIDKNKLKEKPSKSSSGDSKHNYDLKNNDWLERKRNNKMNSKEVETIRKHVENEKPNKQSEHRIHKEYRTKSNKDSTSFPVEDLLERLHEEHEVLLTHEDENSIDKVLELYNRDLEIYSGDSNDVDAETSRSLENKDATDLLKMKQQLLAELTSDNSLEEGEVLDDEEQIKVETDSTKREIHLLSTEEIEPNIRSILKDDSYKNTNTFTENKQFELSKPTSKEKEDKVDKVYATGERRVKENTVVKEEGRGTIKNNNSCDILCEPMEIEQLEVENLVVVNKGGEGKVSQIKTILNDENVPIAENNITNVSNIFEESSRMEMNVADSRINIISHIVVGATSSQHDQNLSRDETSLDFTSKKSIQTDSVDKEAVKLAVKPLLDENRSCTSVSETYDSSSTNLDASSSTLNESYSDKPRKRITPILLGPATSKLARSKKCDRKKIRSPEKCYGKNYKKRSKDFIESSDDICTEYVGNSKDLKTKQNINFEKESENAEPKTKDEQKFENLDKAKNQIDLPYESNRPENILVNNKASDSSIKKSDHPELTLKFVRSRGDSNNYEISTDDERGLSERVANPEPAVELQNDIIEAASVDALDDVPKELIRHEDLKDTGGSLCTQNALSSSSKSDKLVNTLARNSGVSKGKVMENLKREFLGNRELLNESSFSVDDSSTSKSPKVFKQAGGKIMDLLKKEVLNNLSVTMTEDTESFAEHNHTVWKNVASSGKNMDMKLYQALQSSEESKSLEKIETVVQESTEKKIVDNQLINILRNDEHARKLPNKQKSKGKYIIRIQQQGDSNSKDSNSSSDMETEEIEIDRSIKIQEKSIQICPKKRFSIGKRINNQLMEVLKKQAEALEDSDDSTNSEDSLLTKNGVFNKSEETSKTTDIKDFKTFRNITPETEYPENQINTSMPTLNSNSSPCKKTPVKTSAQMEKISGTKNGSIEAKMINIFGEDITLDQSDLKLDNKYTHNESQIIKNQSSMVPSQGNLCSQTPLWKQMEISDDSTDESDLFQPKKIFPQEEKNPVQPVPLNEDIFAGKNQVCELQNTSSSKNLLNSNKEIVQCNSETSSVSKTVEIQKMENLNPQKISQILSQEIKLKNPLRIDKIKTSPKKPKSAKRKAKSSAGESFSKRSKKSTFENSSPKKTKSLFPAIRLNPVRRSPRKSKKVENKQPPVESESLSDSDKPLKVAEKPIKSSRRKTPVNKKNCESPKATPKRKKSTPTTSIEPNNIPTPDFVESPENVDITPIIRRRNSKSSSPGPRQQNVSNISKSSVDSTPVSLNKGNMSRRSSSGKNAKILEQTFEEESLKAHNVPLNENEKNPASSSPLIHFENMLIEQKTNAEQKVIENNKKDGDAYPVIHIEDLTFADNCDFQNKSLLNFVEAINVTSSNFNLSKDSNIGVEPTKIVTQENSNLLTFTSYLNSSKLSTSTPLKINKTQRCISFQQNIPAVLTSNGKENEKINSVNLDTEKSKDHQNSSIEGHNTTASSQNSSLNRSDLDSSAERKGKVVNYTFGVGIKRSKTRRPVVELVD